MPEEKNVRILEWPKSKARLEHHFELDKPCPVAIVFEDNPAFVEVSSDPKKPVHIDMDMKVSADDPIPVCVRICEPICAESNYRIGVNLLGQPLAEITVRGTTKLFNCEDDEEPELVCVDFREYQPGKSEKLPFQHDIISFIPLNEQQHVDFTALPAPPAPTQLLLPREGMQLDFEQPVSNLMVEIVNFGNSIIELIAYYGSTQIYSATEVVDNTRQALNIDPSNVTSLVIRGGSNEAAIIQICYSLSEEAPKGYKG